jgi:hypothetical protein
MFGALLTAVVVLGVIGMGIMLGGSLVLRKEAGLSQELILLFMFLIFLITFITEIFLVRQLSRLTDVSVKTKSIAAPSTPLELRPPAIGSMGEPVASVTENTTRTLEYAPREQRT